MTQKTKITIIATAIILVTLLGYWLFNRQRLQISAPGEVSASPTVSKPLTAEEIAKIEESLTPTEEKELGLVEKQKIEVSATAPSRQNNLSREEMEKLLQSLSASQ